MTSRPRLDARRASAKNASLREEPRGEARIAPGSERPPAIGDVTRQVILPALLELLLRPRAEDGS